MKRLKISASAHRDLQNIADHTRKRWGDEQKQSYLGEIRAAFQTIRENPEIGIDRSPLKAGYRSLACRQHIIFYRCDDDTILIARIIHHRMDIKTHI